MSVPELPEADRVEGLRFATHSPRQRYAKVLHQPGAYFNEVFNFMMRDSYMQPHQHPGVEKIEEIHVLEGRVNILFFDDYGRVTSKCEYGEGSHQVAVIPAFAWHTYVVATDWAITYETMNGIYDPRTWKQFAAWAPAEDTVSSVRFLQQLAAL